VPLLRWLVAGFSLQEGQFDPRPDHARFLDDKEALRQVFLRVLRLFAYCQSTNPPHSCTVHLQGESTETFQNQCFFGNRGALDRRTFTFLYPLVQVVCHHPFASEGQFDPWPDHVEDEGAMGQLFLRSLLFSPVSIIPLSSILNSILVLHLREGQSGGSMEAFIKQCCFGYRRAEKYLR